MIIIQNLWKNLETIENDEIKNLETIENDKNKNLITIENDENKNLENLETIANDKSKKIKEDIEYIEVADFISIRISEKMD